MGRIFAASTTNHSLKTSRGAGGPGGRVKAAYPGANGAPSPTRGPRPATAVHGVGFARPPAQAVGGAAAGCPEGGVAGAIGGRKRPAGAGDPFSTRPQPGCVSATEVAGGARGAQ